MIITIEVDKEDFGKEYPNEIARILKEIANDIEEDGSPLGWYPDSNGNPGCSIKFLDGENNDSYISNSKYYMKGIVEPESMPVCPLCDNKLLEFDDVTLIFANGGKGLAHIKCIECDKKG